MRKKGQLEECGKMHLLPKKTLPTYAAVRRPCSIVTIRKYDMMALMCEHEIRNSTSMVT